MVMPNMNSWSFFFSLLYLFIVCGLNVLLAPLLFIGTYTGYLKTTIWKNYLITNGAISVFLGSFISYWVISDLIKNHLTLEREIVFHVVGLGIIFQEIFFVIWLVYFFRKKLPSVSFYRGWKIVFFMLYLLPTIIYFTNQIKVLGSN